MYKNGTAADLAPWGAPGAPLTPIHLGKRSQCIADTLSMLRWPHQLQTGAENDQINGGTLRWPTRVARRAGGAGRGQAGTWSRPAELLAVDLIGLRAAWEL